MYNKWSNYSSLYIIRNNFFNQSIPILVYDFTSMVCDVIRTRKYIDMPIARGDEFITLRFHTKTFVAHYLNIALITEFTSFNV